MGVWLGVGGGYVETSSAYMSIYIYTLHAGKAGSSGVVRGGSLWWKKRRRSQLVAALCASVYIYILWFNNKLHVDKICTPIIRMRIAFWDTGI